MCSLYGISVLIYLQRLVKQDRYMCIGKDAYRITYKASVSFSVDVTQ